MKSLKASTAEHAEVAENHKHWLRDLGVLCGGKLLTIREHG